MIIKDLFDDTNIFIEESLLNISVFKNMMTPSQSNVSSNGEAKSEIIRLNVGGARFEVSRDTLMRCEGSMLASLISGKWKEGHGEKEIFIDRDGRLFGFILAYLRSDRVFVPDLMDQAALQAEFEYFGIDADLAKVSVKLDFVTIHELSKEIKKYEGIIEGNKKKIAAIKESYRLANDFSSRSESQNLYLRHDIDKDVDKDLLRECLLSRGLYVVCSGSRESGAPTLSLCVAGMQDKYGKKNSK